MFLIESSQADAAEFDKQRKDGMFYVPSHDFDSIIADPLREIQNEEKRQGLMPSGLTGSIDCSTESILPVIIAASEKEIVDAMNDVRIEIKSAS